MNSIPNPIECKNCGKQYRIKLVPPDELFNLISNSIETLCPQCVLDRVEPIEHEVPKTKNTDLTKSEENWLTLANRLLEEYKDFREFNSGHWEDMFNRVFDVYNIKLRSTGIIMDWHDPDTSYRDDVIAFIEAVKEMKKIIEEK